MATQDNRSLVSATAWYMTTAAGIIGYLALLASMFLVPFFLFYAIGWVGLIPGLTWSVIALAAGIAIADNL